MSVQAPLSDDGIYGLVDLSPARVAPKVEAVVSTPAPAPAAVPERPVRPATTKTGLFSRFLRKEKPAEPKDEATDATTKPSTGPAGPKLRSKRKKGAAWRYEGPAWVVSFMVHLSIIGGLGLFAISAENIGKPKSFDSAPFDPRIAAGQAEELVHIYADPSSQPRDQAVGDTAANSTAAGAGSGLGVGTGPPSATPRVGMRTAVGEGRSLPQVKAVKLPSAVAMLPNMPSRDFGLGGSARGGGGGAGISGDVTMGTKDVGEALDQLAREILRHLSAHKLTVIWLFDESNSMRDDQKAIKEKFGRVSSELNLNIDEDKKSAGALNHVIVGFGESLHPEISKPTTDINAIGKAIDRLAIDMSGTERTCEAITRVVNEYSRGLAKDRRLLLVLVTDESGDDGQNVEEARQALVSHGVPIYVIGRQSLFGYDLARLLYIDPVTKDPYWPTIKRGPETAAPECLQIDGLHDRWDEQPSGFAPYELARLAKDSGGIYFLLPSEENMRVRQREKAYSMTTLKEYVPDYENRTAYLARRDKSDLRRLIADIIQLTTKDFVHRRSYPVNPEECIQAMLEEAPKARAKLQKWMEIEQRLKAGQNLRDREPDRRWQAHYDLILAQSVVYQVKTYEYLACLDEMVDLMRKGQLKPKTIPIPDQLNVYWVINHSPRKKAPKEETEKKYAEGKRLLDLVIQRHPKTPWADLALDEFNRGFGCQRDEEHYGKDYGERAKLVPKY